MLRVGSPQPPMHEIDLDLEQAPTDMMPPQEAMPPQEEPNPYDRSFDAGVDTDEDSDPKRYIQQLTGKLSQKLRSYNEGLPQPDTDLCKYVAGMINKQVADSISEEDFDEIMNAMKGNVENDNTNESVSHNRQKIDELFSQLGNEDDSSSFEQPQGNVTYKQLPFSTPHFE